MAWSIVRKQRRWHRKPFAKRLMMKMDCANYSLNYGILSILYKKRERLLIPLNYGDYQRSFLMDTTLKRGSVTITDSAIFVTFSKSAGSSIPLRRVGIDINEKSVVESDGTKFDLSEVPRLHTEYGVRRRDFYSAHPNDRRLRKKFAGSLREKRRTKQLLQKVTKEIISKAKVNGEGLVLEKLQGIRNKSRRGNGDGPNKRRRTSLWPFRQLQSYIEYKAKWEGVPVELVPAAWTSRTCHVCGYINRKLKITEREWLCPCGAILDRDLNAAVNIERRGTMPCLGVVRPGARGTDEAVKGNPATPVILRAEAPKGSG